MFPSAVVADTIKHATAMIVWLKLDPQIWHPVVYGQSLNQSFDHAKIVRPLSGVTDEHLVWLSDVLLPRIARRKETVPHFWEPAGSDVPEHEACGFASMWI